MTDSWRLKLQRAEKHMIDIDFAAQSYRDSHPYKLEKIIHRRRQPASWGYRVRMTEQPDETVALVLGDFIHNLRSSLDHVVHACVPARNRSQAAFPVEFSDPWKRAGRKYEIRDAEVRKRFMRQVRGIDPEAETLIEWLQPYNRAKPDTATIGLLSRLDNADKHRRLIVTGTGLESFIITRTFPDGSIVREESPRDRTHYEDGAEVYRVDDLAEWLRGYSESEVKVECSASAEVSIEIAGDGRKSSRQYFHLGDIMSVTFTEVSNVLELLEPYRRP